MSRRSPPIDSTPSACSASLTRRAELIGDLFEHQYGPGQLYEHRWRMNDMVVWGNGAVRDTRGRLDPEVVGLRTLRRVTLGTHTVRRQVENFTDLRDSYCPKADVS